MISGIIINDIMQKKTEVNNLQNSINGPGIQVSASNPLVALNDDDYTNQTEIELTDELLT